MLLARLLVFAGGLSSPKTLAAPSDTVRRAEAPSQVLRSRPGQREGGSRAAESHRQDAEALRAEVGRLQQELARLRAAHVPEDGFAALIATISGAHAIALQDLTPRLMQGSLPVLVGSATHLLLGQRAALRLEFKLDADAAEWTAAGAALLDDKDVPRKVVALWQSTPLRTRGACVVVVEIQDAALKSGGTYTLKLWEAGGGRSITLELGFAA